MGATSDVQELCPACTVRAQDTKSGFCSTCLADHAVERYSLRDLPNMEERRAAWRRRSVHEQAVVTRERQRRHRLLEDVRPRESAPGWADPYVLAQEAVKDLRRVRMALATAGLEKVLPHLERAEELVRQLAWGPEP